ncbi:bacterial transcriptional activator domain-containing protein [Agathobacter sp.]
MEDTIKVQMFGNFRMDYNGSPLVAEKMHKESQFNRLMQVMMYYADKGIAKDKLEELVIGERDLDAPHTALRVIVYKTKQKLAQLGLPGKDLIYLDGGMYYWTSDIKIEEDAREFEKCFEKIRELDAGASDKSDKACESSRENESENKSQIHMSQEEIDEQKLQLYLKAFYLYKGEFLAPYTGETWIAQEAKRYHQMFCECVENAAEIVRRKKEWKMLEMLGNYATKADPLNEWELLTMEAMVETRRYDEASEFYSKVVDYYLKECGIYPSARLMEILEKYSNQMNHTYEILENIQEGMNEDDNIKNKGGYFCSYPVFRGIYQTSVRMMDRTDVPVYLMLCTLVDKDGKQIQSENEMNKYSRQLKECIGESIRHSDVYAKYGKIQFLILLTGISRENCELVQNRINYQFRKKQPRASVKYHVNSVICEL